VALQALVIDFFRRRFGESEECLEIAAPPLYMHSARPVAALARNAFAAMHQRKAGVRILSELITYLTVTGLASL
jgi:hypothetical protein